ncbi:DUF1552 domain-containing protein [Fimbriiglobus ruber]|uniref:Tat (Twin-arginine translocation) pathway signal sequence domain protein n=1 Tax=Fimbriiglobus ruber TaxID=1908690 RepID=A0A225E3S8_9BACT|nr:DUF1552 domain-containing protein [Fimbriiglobus ruber]OWK45448.1 hypothetical protein FRUB_01779 [Fimbriiglobus ruber]
MSNILSQRWLLDRRHFLRGAGATVALPLLDAMTPLRAAPAAGEKPRRSVFVYIPNGVNGMAWQVTKPGRGYDLSPSLKPLEKHRDDFTVFSGLHHPNGLGQAHVCADTWLTGARIDAQNARKYENTVSCDQLMAEVAGVQTRFPSLELSISSGTGQPGNSTTLAFSRDGVPLPAEDNPRHVFNRLFGEEAGGAAAQRARLIKRRSVLDAVHDDASALRRELGADDRAKLDEYLHSVRDVEQRAARLDAWLTVPKPKIDPKLAAPFQRDVSKAQAGEYWRTMFDLIVLALRTDMTRVVTYMNGSEGNGLAIPEIGITQARHNLSHHNGDPVVLDRLAKSDAFLTRMFAGFLDQLKSIQDGGEPLLDRTMVLFGSGMSYGHSHANSNLPILLAGGRGLGLKHGQHLDYNHPKGHAYTLGYEEWMGLCGRPRDDKARLSNVMLTMLQKMGVRTEKFVDSTGAVSEVTA